MLQKIQKMIQKLTEKGQGTVEYALLLAVVAAIAYNLLKSDGIVSQAKQSVANMNQEATQANTLYTEAGGTAASSTTVDP